MGEIITYNGISSGIPRGAQLSDDGLTLAFYERMTLYGVNDWEIKVFSFEQGQWIQITSIIPGCRVLGLSLYNDTISYFGGFSNQTATGGSNFTGNWHILGSFTLDGTNWQPNTLNYEQTKWDTNNSPVRQIIERSGRLIYLKALNETAIRNLHIHIIN